MVTLLSCPLNIISLLLASDLITKFEESLLNLPNAVPPSFSITSVPSASNIISPPASIVTSPAPTKPDCPLLHQLYQHHQLHLHHQYHQFDQHYQFDLVDLSITDLSSVTNSSKLHQLHQFLQFYQHHQLHQHFQFDLDCPV